MGPGGPRGYHCLASGVHARASPLLGVPATDSHSVAGTVGPSPCLGGADERALIPPMVPTSCPTAMRTFVIPAELPDRAAFDAALSRLIETADDNDIDVCGGYRYLADNDEQDFGIEIYRGDV